MSGENTPDEPTEQIPAPTVTERQTAIAAQLIERHGVLTKEMLAREEVAGGFAGLYPVLKAMEESGKVRRGYFVAGLGAAQFAAPGAEDRLRSFRRTTEDETPLILAATDPANVWGNALSWPKTDDESARPMRTAGAHVIILNGRLIGYQNRTGEHLTTFLPAEDPERLSVISVLSNVMAENAVPGRPVLLTKIDGKPPRDSVLAEALLSAGFQATTKGFLHRGLHPNA